MATTHTLTGNLAAWGLSIADLVRADMALQSTETAAVDDDTSTLYVGTQPITVDAETGAWSVEVPATGYGQGWTPPIAGHRVVVVYRDRAVGSTKQTYATKWFAVEADLSIDEVVKVTPTKVTGQLVADLYALRVEAEAAQTAAETAQVAAEAAASTASEVAGLEDVEDAINLVLASGSGTILDGGTP
ncbi:MAG: hypothetical protein CMH83_19385 [Nocardioides sp.]|nr:hypothetical protein [Nocardioides sp.]